MTTVPSRPRATDADCQVLIVGAGPTGLVLACQLLARGIDTRVIDRGDGVLLQSRALGIHARTLEVFDMMGLAEPIIDSGQVVRRFHMFTGHRTLLQLQLSHNGSRFGFMLDLPQDVTERILRSRVAELGGCIDNRVELLAVAQDPRGVTATVRDAAGGERTIRSDWLVGCDGAHSRVRHQLGLDFPGEAYPQDWLLADVHLDWNRPEDEFHAFFRSDGLPLICMPMRDGVWRVILPFTGDRQQRPPTLAEIQQHVSERAPQRVAVTDPRWLAVFRCQRRATGVYRRGRVLLAGDAVHVHSPAGGQGMNTGITDAHNLGWKLALVAAGRASDRLLDTYGQERSRVAADVLALTHVLVTLASTTSPLRRALRDTVLPPVARLTPLQRGASRRLGQTYVGYPDSPLSRPTPDRTRPRPGDRLPDLPVIGPAGPTRLHRLLRGGNAVALQVGPVAGRPPVTGPPGWLDTNLTAAVTVATATEAGRSLGRPGTVLLIRPDGYLAARGGPSDPEPVRSYLRELSGSAPLARAVH